MAVTAGLRAVAAAGLAALSLAACGCSFPGSHGPAQDHSRFEGAALMPDQTVLFSYKRLVYRPAKGIAAFPDGGIPKYLKDEDVLGAYHIPSDSLRILRREPNRRYTDGQGQFAIQRSKGTVALVTRGGQLRRDLAEIGYEDWLIDASTGAAQPLDWRTALPERGRAMTELYLVDGRGTLLFVTTPSPSPSKEAAERDVWLWVRTFDGQYLPVAKTSHYEGMDGDDLIYWIPETRQFMAFDVLTHASRALPGYRVPPREDVVQGVSIETGGKRLLIGRNGGAGWEYAPLPLEPGRLD